MEQQFPIPPKSRMKAREKRAIFPSLIWGGGRGGSRFSIYFVQDCRFSAMLAHRPCMQVYFSGVQRLCVCVLQGND